MSTAGQTLGTRIAAVAGRHASRGRIDDLDQAVAELRAVAANRSDLLADLAGVSQFWCSWLVLRTPSSQRWCR